MIDSSAVPREIMEAVHDVWDEAYALGAQHGYRNSQVTVLAPTGTIGFMMDCDTTGIEPDISLIKYKKLVGGGMLKIVNTTVPDALDRLGYTNGHKAAILDHLEKEETIEGAPYLDKSQLAVFDCAFKPARGTRSIHYLGHIKMIGAVQPFISGAISKTINVPKDATVEEIERAYLEAWKLGAKAVSIYRDGSKRTQPLTTGASGSKRADASQAQRPVRRKLADERAALNHKFTIAGHEGYLTVGKYEDGQPGEIFLRMAKEGSTVSGLMDTIATMTSISLQYGVPLRALVDKFSHTRFEPAGFTNNPSIPIAKSVMDYVFRFLGDRYLQRDSIEDEPEVRQGESLNEPQPLRSAIAGGSGDRAQGRNQGFINQADAPSCHSCGSIMIRSGTCYKCFNCGETSGCS